MISVRICKRCHRVFDAMGGDQNRLCPLCEQGELFQGEFDDDWVGVPDIRADAEEPYMQPYQCKKQLAKMFGINCAMPWEEDEADGDDVLAEEVIVQTAEENEEPFEPLLATYIDYVVEERSQTRKPKVAPGAKRTKKSAPKIQVQRRTNPYLKGDDENGA